MMATEGGRCPRCDVALDTHDVTGPSVGLCPDCGGAWAAAGALTEIARRAPGELSALDLVHADRGTPPPLAQPFPVCPGCGAALDEHTFPAAHDVPLLSCRPCRMIYARDGQLTALQRAVTPGVAVATIEVEPELVIEVAAEEPEPEPDEEPAPRFRRWWIERIPGQPWLSWAVLGMPLWFALLLMLVPGALFVYIGRDIGLGTDAWLLALVAHPFWAFETLILTYALSLTFTFSGEGGLFGFQEMYILLLRVMAVGMAVCAVIGFIAWPNGVMPVSTFPLRMVVYGVLFVRVVELDLEQFVMLIVINSVLHLFIPY